ncbi:trigger factor [candidate division KSB1 bacterium]
MKVTVNDTSEITKELLIEVPEDVVKAAIEEETKKTRKKVQMPGFRKGKAPLQMIQSQYGGQIMSTAVENSINENYRTAIEQEKLFPLGPADISDMEFEPGKPLKFKATIEIEPKIELSGLKDMKVEKEEPAITPEMVDETLKQIQKRFGTQKVVERPSEKGDKITVDLAEVDPASGVPIIGKQFPNQVITLGENAFGPDFEEQLIGLKPGESKTVSRKLDKFTLTDPDQNKDKPSEETFIVKVTKIEQVDLPEIDDDLAKEMKYDDVDTLKKNVEETLTAQMQDQANEKFRRSMEEEAIRLIDPPAPKVMLEKYLDNYEASLKSLSDEAFDSDKMREDNKEYAKKRVQWFIIRQELVNEHKFEVTDKDLDDHLEEHAKKHGLDHERVKIEFRSGKNREDLRNILLEKQIYDYLENLAEVSVVKKNQ